jgi:hypothetical protein
VTLALSSRCLMIPRFFATSSCAKAAFRNFLALASDLNVKPRSDARSVIN